MNGIKLLTVAAVIVCLGTVSGVVVQRRELSSLRAEQERLLAKSAAERVDPAIISPREDSQPGSSSQAQEVSSELLRLRNEVTQMGARRRELAGVAGENERLRAQLANQRTNAAAGAPLPSGYLRKAQAQMAGYTTPENTIQSFLWALQNHDFTNLLRAFTPEAAQKLQSQMQLLGESADGFWKGTDFLPGLGIQGREELPDGTVQIQVEVAPGAPAEKFRLEQVNGEWKMSKPF